MDCPEYRVGRFTLQPFRQLLDGTNPVSIGRKALELLSVLAKAERGHSGVGLAGLQVIEAAHSRFFAKLGPRLNKSTIR